MPPKVEQAKSRKLFKEVFAKELADRSPGSRGALAQRFLKEAASNAQAPSDQFVLLVAAIEAGKEAGELRPCMKAADVLAASYDVDALQLKVDAAMKMTLRASTPSTSADNCRAGLELVDQLMADDNYAAAVRLVAAMRPAAAGDAALSQQLQNRAKEIDAVRAADERIAAQKEKLKASPSDPAANLAVGKFFCFFKGDWNRGLPMLAQGGDPALAALAKKDMTGTSDPNEKVDLGDRWWELADKAGGIAQARILARARQWYEDAEPGLAGLSKVRVDKRIKDIVALSASQGTAGPPPTLLDAMCGTHCTRQDDGTFLLSHGGRITSPESFHTPVAFQFVVMSDEKDFRIAYAADQIILNWEGNPDQLRVDGGPANGRHKTGAGQLPANEWVTIVLVVRRNEMTLSVDGTERYKVNADFGRVDEKLSLTASGGDLKIKSISAAPLGSR